MPRAWTLQELAPQRGPGTPDPWRQCQAPTPGSVQRREHGHESDSRLGPSRRTPAKSPPSEPVSSPTKVGMIRSAAEGMPAPYCLCPDALSRGTVSRLQTAQIHPCTDLGPEVQVGLPRLNQV